MNRALLFIQSEFICGKKVIWFAWTAKKEKSTNTKYHDNWNYIFSDLQCLVSKGCLLWIFGQTLNYIKLWNKAQWLPWQARSFQNCKTVLSRMKWLILWLKMGKKPKILRHHSSLHHTFNMKFMKPAKKLDKAEKATGGITISNDTVGHYQ